MFGKLRLKKEELELPKVKIRFIVAGGSYSNE